MIAGDKADTRSECLFQKICRRHGYKTTSLERQPHLARKSADFRVTANGSTFIVEVKELTPNRDDLRQIREMKETGTTSGGSTVGARAREAIKQASAQLRLYKGQNLPLLIVLYDNVRTADGRVAHPMCYLEPHCIDAAMYGDLVVMVPIGRGTPRTADRSGGGRTMTDTTKTYISAVAVISDWDDESFLIYHNRFAEEQFPRTVFNDSKCYHLEKRGTPFAEPWKWHAIETSNQADRLQ
jgi:hypothetical protein